jgi:multidrug efflux system membrane fusion protein
MRMIMRRHSTFIFFTGVLILPLIFGACSDKKSQGALPLKNAPVPVLAAVAIQKDIPLQITAIGTGEADSTVQIKTRVDGQILGVYFKEGDFVKKDQLLFKLDPRPFEAALRQAEANLKRDMALAENAEGQAKRYAVLVEKDFVAREQYDQLRANAAAQDAVVQSDKALVENARLLLEYTSIAAPISGKTGSLMIHGGNVVKANDLPLVVIERINPIKVAFSIPEREFNEVKKASQGRKLSVQAIIMGEENNPEDGTLDFMNNEIDNATGTIKLKGIFRNSENRLWPGQFVNVVLELGMDKNAVLVPSEAVQNGQDGQFVFVVKPDMSVEARKVAVKRTYQNFAVLAEGVAAGETVVTDGQMRLAPGAKAVIKKAENPIQPLPGGEKVAAK